MKFIVLFKLLFQLYVMNKAPYSLVEAKHLYDQYQYLVGLPFDVNGTDLIACVTVSPSEENSKNRFIIFYLLYNDADMALQSEPDNMLYDVIVMTGSCQDEELRHKDLYTWLEEQGRLPATNPNIVQAQVGFRSPAGM